MASILKSPIEDALSKAPAFGLPETFKQSTEGQQQPTFTPGSVPFQTEFNAASSRYGVPVNVLMALAQQESSFNPTALGVPTKYGRAKGMMQYIDSTASAMGINPYDPVQSIDAAAKQLRTRLDQGYSMQEAVSAHFGGDDRRQWGEKTRAYGVEVMGKAQRFFDGTTGPIKAGTQQQPAQRDYAADYPAAQSAMENMDQTGLRTRAQRVDALLSGLNENEPDRYRALTPEEVQQYMAEQAKANPQQLQGDQQKVQQSPTGEKIDLSQSDQKLADSQQKVAETNQGIMDQALAALSDGGNLLASGVNIAAQDARELVSRIPLVGKSIVEGADSVDRWMNGKSSEEIFKEWDKNVEKNLTPEMTAARKKAWVYEPGDTLPSGEKSTGYSFGPAWSDPRAYASGLLESLPEMAVTMGGAGRMAQFAYKRAIVGGMSKEAAAKVASRTALVAGSFLEGGLGGASSARETREQILKMDPAQLKDSAALKSLMDSGKSFEEARSELAESAASQAFVLAGITTGMFGGMGDRAMAKIITGNSGRLKAAVSGFIGEGLFEEVPQSALQQVSQNYAMQEADPNTPLMKGVANQAAGGLAVGGLMGAGMGAAAPRARGDQQPAATEDNPQVDPAQVDPAAATEEEAVATAPTPSRDDTGLSDDAGPVERALRGTQPQPDTTNGNFWGGEPGTTINMQAKGDPDTAMVATVERYERDGSMTVRSEDGTPYTVSPDEVDIVGAATVQQSTSQQMQDAGTTQEVKDERAAAQPQEDAEAAATRQDDITKALEKQGIDPATGEVLDEQKAAVQTKTEDAPADRPLTDLSEDELRDRMRYFARQAKQSGWDTRLTKARREVETVLNAKIKERQQTEADSVAGNADQQPGTEMAAAEQADQPGTVRGGVEGSETNRGGRGPGDIGPDTVAGAGQRVDADTPATVASTNGDEALAGADNKPKWFSTAEKAQNHLTKRKLSGFRVVETKPNRFELHADATLTNEDTTAAAQDNSDVSATAPEAKTAQTPVNPRTNRAKKLVGAVGEVVSPDGDVGNLPAGGQYQITRIEKNGTIHVMNRETAGNTTITPAEMERARSRNVNWSKTDVGSAVAATVAKSAPAQTQTQQGDDWTRFDDESGTLLVPRAQMPQIKSEHRGALVNFLNARGIAHQEETVPAASLKATQAEYSPSRVARAAERTEGDRAILVDKTGQILDGHHQWMAAKEKSEDIRVIRFDADILDLLTLGQEFPSSTVDTSSASEPAKSETKPAKSKTDAGEWKALAEAALARVPDTHPLKRKWAANVANGLKSESDRAGVLRQIEKAGQNAEAYAANYSEKPEVTAAEYANARVMSQADVNANGDWTLSPWLFPDGRIIGSNGDHISLSDVFDYTGYRDMSKGTGAIRAQFHKAKSGHPEDVSFVSLQLFDDQKLTPEQYKAVASFLKANDAKIMLGVDRSGQNMQNVDKSEVTLAELRGHTSPMQETGSKPAAIDQVDRNTLSGLIDTVNNSRRSLADIGGEMQVMAGQVGEASRALYDVPNTRSRAEFAAELQSRIDGTPAPQKTASNEGAKPEVTAEKDADRFSENKLFTADKVAAARARMKSKFGQLNSGLDPEMLIDGMTIAGAYIESGVRKFGDYARAMVDDFGDGVKPYLLSFWEGARNYPGLDNSGMTSVADSAAEHQQLLTPADRETPAVGEIVETPAKRTRKTGQKGDLTLTQDFGVDHIDGYGENTSGRETGSDLKDEFLKNGRAYLNAVADRLEDIGFKPTTNGKGKFVGAVNVNAAGDAVSGDITLTMDGPNGTGIYMNVSGTSMRGMVPTTVSGVGIMYRATKPDDKFGGRSTNQWAPVNMSANDLAALVAEHAENIAQRDAYMAEQQAKRSQARPTGSLDDMVSNFDTEVSNNGTATELGKPGESALGGVPASEVRGAAEGREAGRSPAGSSTTDSGRNEPAGRERDAAPRSVGDDARAVPVSTSGSEPAGRGANAERSSTPRDNGDAAGRGRVRPAAGVTAQEKPADLFTINADEIGQGGDKTKYANNLAAIRLLKELEGANRQATADEQAVLAKYIGWGGLPGAFERTDGSANKGWEKQVAELKAILTPEELQAAAASTRNAHYTSPEIVSGMWKLMQHLGFTGGRVIEPSVGVGNFFGLMPQGVRSASALHGVELDRITSGIAAQLYPEAKIARMGYQEYAIPDGYFDAAVGNPPFGSEKLYDGNRKDLSGFSIHNYFFARTVDALRPGGVMAMVVTNRFLDSTSDKARQYIGDRADLLGAIRLPNNAFAKNAGTEVTTDIIVLRRREAGEMPKGPSWSKIVEHTDKDGNTVPLNEYFKFRPEMMLGDFGAYGTMYRKGDTALVARDGQNTQQLLEQAISRFPDNVMTPAVEVKPETRETVQAENVRVGSMFIDGSGRVMVRGDDQLGERTGTGIEFRSVKAEERVKGMLRIRDSLSRLRQLQLSNTASERAIDEARTLLNNTYDGFVKANGPINSQANKLLFRDDPTWPQISALEDEYDKGISADVAKRTGEEARKQTAKKAAIFTRRTQQPYSAPTSAATAKDALVATLAERGRVDMAMMENLYGKSPEAIASELGDLIYNDPATGWQTRDGYLSGNVKAKLAAAEAAAKTDPQYARNVEALREVQPKDIEAVDINVKPGASWVPTDTMAAFADHIAESTGSTAFYNRLTANWSFPKLTASSSASTRYGTGRLNVGQVLEAAAAQKAVQVFDTHQDGSRTLNETETQLANDKVNQVKQEWDRWIWSDDARRSSLSRLYNDQFNTDVARDFDGSHLSFPGKISDDIIRLRPHQGNFVWRVVQGSNTLADHVVGAGKTFSLIAAAMELRRMGLARKPVFTVPNHLVGQWAQDFIKLYPGANVLAATKADFEKANRKRFFARIATGDWDAVIVAHSSFGKVGVKPETEAEFIREEIADLTSSIEAIEEAEGKRSRNVKQAQERKAKMEERLKKLLDTDNKDDSLYWDDLGIDALFVDEAHEFKNLAYSSGMRGVAGMGNAAGSQKATDMYMKTRIVRKATGGRNVVFATGTPISNTMAEMYTMQRYLDYDNLKGSGLAHFDAWARMFGEVVTDWELSPSGQYKMNSRFSKFVNMPELMQRYSSFADVINRDDINRQLAAQGKRLPVPKVKGGKPQNIVVPRSDAQADYIGEPIKDADGIDTDRFPEGTLVYRAENLPKKAEKGGDNMLKIMSDARKAALDMRLIDPEARDNPYSKVNDAADRIKADYDSWSADRGAQLVFIDLSTPKGARADEAARIRDLIERSESKDPDVADAAQAELDKISPDEIESLNAAFSVYDDLKQKLVDRGIPAAEIAFIHDAKTDLQKVELFGKVRSGRVRVMFGSTAKMGAGMNVQERLVALHHLDAPWRPSDLEQREGRIIRQGNKLYDRDPEGFEVGIYRYATKQTLDSRMWQTIEGKANFIEQVRKGATGTREVEDIAGEAANAAEMKAASSGNPLILEEMTLRQRIRTLENERTAHDRDQFRIRDRIRMEESNVRVANRTLEELREDAKLPQPAKFEATIGGQTFDKRKDAGEAIIDTTAQMELNGIEEQPIGTYGGFKLSLSRVFAGSYTLHVEGTGDYTAKVDLQEGADPTGIAMRMTNTVKDLDGAIEQMEQALARSQKAIPSLQEQVSAWPKVNQLDDAIARHGSVIEKLRPKKKTDEQAVAKPATDGTEPQYNDIPEGGTEFAGDVAAELAAHDEMFRYPRATGQRSLQGVFDAVVPDVKVKWEAPQLDDNSSETGVTHIRGVTGEGRDINIYQTGDEVWFDVSNVKQGEGGAGIYQAVADYALNTGRKFVGDPDGLSDIALRRRTEAMLSSALKHGTTDHIEPHERQLKGDKALGVPPMRWKDGDFAFNIQSLIDTSLANIKAAIPEIDRARYDFATGTFRTGQGKPLPDELLTVWASHPRVREARAGRSSLKRAILLNSLARTESAARSGLLERIYQLGSARGLDRALTNTFYDWDTRYSRLPEGNRIQLTTRLRKLQQQQALGQITPEQYSDHLAELADWLEERSMENAAKRAFAERQRGADMVLERLHRARRQGEISEHAADIAIWALNRNPQLADDLGISIRSKGGSQYDRVERIARLMTENMRDTAPIHEILHHTERMLPPGVQKGIAAEYNAAWKRAYKNASPELRAALDALRLSAFGDKAARDATMAAFESGLLQYHQHYQLTNASEYWAVNAAEIMANRHIASKKGWVARAREWMREFIRKAKAVFGLPSDAAVLRGLDAVMKGDGSFQSSSMLAVNPVADTPLRDLQGDYADQPKSSSGMDPAPRVPTDAEDTARVRSWWNTAKNLPRDKMTDAMQKGLAVVPMRPLVLELGRNLPAAAEYMRLKQSMDAMRNTWHARTDAIAQRWLKYRKSNDAENVTLMNLMHDATIQQVDPSQGFLARMTDRDRDALRYAAAGSDKENELLQKAAEDKKRREAWNGLNARFKQLSGEAQSLFKAVRDEYDAIATEYERVLMGNMEKAINVRIKKAEREHRYELQRITDEGLTGQDKQEATEEANRKLKIAKTKTAWNRKARITQLRQQFEMERLQGPYFPLARFGNLFVTVRDAESGRVESFSRFEKAAEQREFADLMRENKKYTVQVGTLDDTGSLRKAVDANFVADVEDILADLPNAEQVKDEVWQRYLESLPDFSVRKNRIHRTGRKGFISDALRAYGNQMFHGSHQLARLAHTFDMEEALDASREEAQHSKDPVRDGLVVNEIEKRHEFVMNPKGGPLVQVISQASFIYFLAASPKAAIVNLSQTVIMGVPILGAYDGSSTGMVRAANQLMRAMGDFTRGKGNAQNSKRLTNDERKAMQEAYDTGIIDRTQSHDLAGVGETGVEYSPARTKVMAMLAWGFHQGERLNREVTFLASYRMAKAKGLPHKEAVQKANDLTWKTHFDYQNTSRPRVMHSDTMKALLVFRNFSINMLWRLFRDIHQATKGDTPEVKREARIQLAGTTGMMMLNAGLTGTWFFGIAMMLAGMFMDDGEDPEAELKKNMIEALGPQMAGIVLDGVPGYLTGTSLSDSIGMRDLWFRDPSTSLEGKGAMDYWKAQLLGAPPSIVDNAIKGYSMIKEGQVWRGIETIMPKAIKDPMKAYRYATEGATNKRGDVIVQEIDAGDVIRQALGFTPAKLAEQYDLNNAGYNRQDAILKQRKQLLDDYWKADEAEDDAKLDKLELAIDRYNEKYPEMEITPKTLSRSAKTREKNAEDATGGMRYNRKLRDRILDEQSPTIYR